MRTLGKVKSCNQDKVLQEHHAHLPRKCLSPHTNVMNVVFLHGHVAAIRLIPFFNGDLCDFKRNLQLEDFAYVSVVWSECTVNKKNK